LISRDGCLIQIEITVMLKKKWLMVPNIQSACEKEGYKFIAAMLKSKRLMVMVGEKENLLIFLNSFLTSAAYSKLLLK